MMWGTSRVVHALCLVHNLLVGKNLLADRRNSDSFLYHVKYEDLSIFFSIYTRKNLTSCSKSANKPSTSCVRTACPKLSTSLEQAVNIL